MYNDFPYYLAKIRLELFLAFRLKLKSEIINIVN